MAWYSLLAVYLLFWVFTLFLVLPYGVQTTAEQGAELVPGQAESAPNNLVMRKKLMWTTIISALLFSLFVLNWEMSWVTRADLEALVPRPEIKADPTK